MATVTNAQKMRWEAAVQEVKILKAQREMVYRWLREPDYIQNANTEWMVNWLGRRPIAECSPRHSLTVTSRLQTCQSARYAGCR